MIEAAVPVSTQPGVFQLTLFGKLYTDTVPELETRLREAIDAGAAHIILDCAAVEQMDSSALTAVIAALKQLFRKNRGSITFVAINSHLDRVLTLTQMKQYFPVADSVADALARLRTRT